MKGLDVAALERIAAGKAPGEPLLIALSKGEFDYAMTLGGDPAQALGAVATVLMFGFAKERAHSSPLKITINGTGLVIGCRDARQGRESEMPLLRRTEPYDIVLQLKRVKLGVIEFESWDGRTDWQVLSRRLKREMVLRELEGGELTDAIKELFKDSIAELVKRTQKNKGPDPKVKAKAGATLPSTSLF